MSSDLVARLGEGLIADASETGPDITPDAL